MLTNKNDYRAGLGKEHIMTSALGLNSGQQILELGSRWVCDLEAPSSQASASIMWQLEEELTAEAERMLEPFQLSWNQAMQQMHIFIPAFTIPPGPFVLTLATQPAL